MKTFTITVHTTNGPQQVECFYKKGSYAAHPRIGQPGHYTITHIPTGFCIAIATAKARASLSCRVAADRMPPELDALVPGDDPRVLLTADALDRCRRAKGEVIECARIGAVPSIPA